MTMKKTNKQANFFDLFLLLLVLFICFQPKFLCFVINPEQLEQTLCKSKACPYYGKCVLDDNGFFTKCVCPSECETNDLEFNLPFNNNELAAPREFSLCGNDGLDYANLCELKRQSCLLAKEIKVFYLGSCSKIIFGDFRFLCTNKKLYRRAIIPLFIKSESLI